MSARASAVRAPDCPSAPAVSDVDLEMVRLAGEWWPNAAAKERAIRDRFGIPPVRFYQRVNALLEQPAAQAAEPVVVNRLRRIRDGKAQRLGRRQTGERP